MAPSAPNPTAAATPRRWIWPVLLVSSALLMLIVGFVALKLYWQNPAGIAPTPIVLRDFADLLDSGRIESMTLHNSTGKIEAVVHWVDASAEHRYEVTTAIPPPPPTGEDQVAQVLLRHAFDKHVVVNLVP